MNSPANQWPDLRIWTAGKAWSRYLWHYPGQLTFAIIGIALGVAVVVSIDLAKDSALSAFVEATRTISGKASYRIVATSGQIDETLYPRLKLSNLPLCFLPKIEGNLRIGSLAGKNLRIVGVDPFAETEAGLGRNLIRTASGATDLRQIAKIVTEPNHVLIAESSLQQLDLEPDNVLRVIAANRAQTLKLVKIADFPDPLEKRSTADLVITDIANAQEILDLEEQLSRIDVIASDDQIDPEVLQRLRQQLPDHVELISYRQINSNAHTLTAAFYSNLTALSLLSLMVGMFLIYNTINFLTIRRRQTVGILRAIGVSRWQIAHLVIAEAAGLGLIGTVIGLVFGSLLANGLLNLISNTIDKVYFSLPNASLMISLPVLIKGLGLGTLVSIVSSLFPALQATRALPAHAMLRSRLETESANQFVAGTIVGIFILVLGIAAIWMSERSIFWGFTGLMLLVLGCALITPGCLLLFSRLLDPLVRSLFGAYGALPIRSLRANLSRSGFAVAALMVAISASIGVQIMVFSFRLSVNDWLEKRLGADLYISAASGTGQNGPLTSAYRTAISGINEIRSIGSVQRRTFHRAEGNDELRIYELGDQAPAGFAFSAGNPETIWQDFQSKDTVIITESYAYKRRLGIESSLELPTDQGARQFQVTGIYADYNPGQGIVAMSRSTYRRHWQDDRYSAFSIYVNAGTDLALLKSKLRQYSDPNYVLDISEKSTIITASMRVFDQAFAVTGILQWVAACIAFLGVFSVLTAIQLDRVREYGILRASGMTTNQLSSLIVAESAVMGGCAGLLAIPVGIMSALILVYVISQRSFGWTMSFHLAPEILLQGLLSGVIAALAASVIPCTRMARLKVSEALRTE